MEPARKRPVCHTCGYYMAGHRRNNGLFICPEPTISDSYSENSASTSSGASSHSSHSPTPRPSVSAQQTARPPRIDQSVPLPPRDHGPWRWRNPNYVSPAPSFVYTPSEASTGQSTFIVDDEGKFTGVTSSGRSWLDSEGSDPHDPFAPPPLAAVRGTLAATLQDKQCDPDALKPQALNITFGEGSGPKWIVFGEDQHTVKRLLSGGVSSKAEMGKGRVACDWYPLLGAGIIGGIVALSALMVLT